MSKASATSPGIQTWLSSKKYVSDWLNIEPTLAAADAGTWQTVVNDYYRDRLQTRYLDPIDLMRKHGPGKGEGFSIVAIQCSLIEFLESCYQGINYEYGHRRGFFASIFRPFVGGSSASDFTYSDSGKIFVSFLTTRSPVNQSFPTRSAARDFYRDVRCGVLHEARTKGAWIIRDRKPAGSALAVDYPNRILYRDDFQDDINAFITGYCAAVPGSIPLREAFVRKFNHLCRA
jgi:hypothetical protein